MRTINIRNKTRKFTIIKKARLCKAMLCRAFGFMFRFREPSHGLVFEFPRERRADLHMLFVFFTIDVLFLDKNKKVIEIKKDFRPFGYYSPRSKSKYVIELPRRALGRTKPGDIIDW